MTGSVIVKIKTTIINNMTYLKCVVIDTGTGMNEEKVKSLCQMF